MAHRPAGTPGCRCTPCRAAHAETQRAFGRARAQQRLPAELWQQLLDAIYAGQPFRTVLRDLDLTANQVWGVARVDREWSAALEAALTATRRDDPQARHECSVRGGLCLQRVSGAPAPADGEEPLTPGNPSRPTELAAQFAHTIGMIGRTRTPTRTTKCVGAATLTDRTNGAPNTGPR
jgi:hypothetical protein